MNELVANAELCISKAIESYERDDIKKAIHFLQKSLRIHRTDRAADLLSEYVSIDDGLIKPKRQAPTRPQLKAEEAKTETKTENILDKTFQNDIERILSIPKHEIAYHYLVLGLDHTKSPTLKEIAKKYKKTTISTHPDKNDDSPESNEAFTILKLAYEILSDAAKKEDYDYRIENGITEEVEKDRENDQFIPDSVQNYTRVDGRIYSGEINKLGKAHGYGDMQFKPNDYHDDSEIHEDGMTRIVQAKFENDEIKQNEVRIDFVVPDGQEMFYVGQWKTHGSNILRHGRGKMTWLNGSTYDGLWKNDCMHDMRPAHKVNSKFVCQIENGGYVYVGNWDMGIRTGQGMMRNLSPEETYVGGWDMDSYNGFGSYETEYHRYDGQFLHGKKRGVGTLTSRSDGSFHKGMWRNDLFHGQNQQVYNAETDQLFVGVFEDNKRGIGSVQSNFRGIRR